MRSRIVAQPQCLHGKHDLPSLISWVLSRLGGTMRSSRRRISHCTPKRDGAQGGDLSLEDFQIRRDDVEVVHDDLEESSAGQ